MEGTVAVLLTGASGFVGLALLERLLGDGCAVLAFDRRPLPDALLPRFAALPGTLTVVAGATGIGKTQLGLRWAETGARAEGARGVICDLTSRGDSQNHLPYARMQLDWEIHPYPVTHALSFEDTWDWSKSLGGYYHPIERAGRRVGRGDLDPEAWHEG